MTMLMTRPTLVEAEPVLAPMERAEAMLADFEAVLLTLNNEQRADLGDELIRLAEIAESATPYEVAAKLAPNTGANRASIVWARDHDLAHNVVVPRLAPLMTQGALALRAAIEIGKDADLDEVNACIEARVDLGNEIEARYGERVWWIATNEVRDKKCWYD